MDERPSPARPPDGVDAAALVQSGSRAMAAARRPELPGPSERCPPTGWAPDGRQRKPAEQALSSAKWWRSRSGRALAVCRARWRLRVLGGNRRGGRRRGRGARAAGPGLRGRGGPPRRGWGGCPRHTGSDGSTPKASHRGSHRCWEVTGTATGAAAEVDNASGPKAMASRGERGVGPTWALPARIGMGGMGTSRPAACPCRQPRLNRYWGRAWQGPGPGRPRCVPPGGSPAPARWPRRDDAPGPPNVSPFAGDGPSAVGRPTGPLPAHPQHG